MEPNLELDLDYKPTKKHYLMLCELHSPEIHGECNTSIGTHYLVYDIFESLTGESFHNLNNRDIPTSTSIPIIETATNLNNHYNKLSRRMNMSFYKKQKHPTIRNYHAIISRNNYIKPEIGEYIILPTQEAVAILKTFWLRIIQRKWKKVFLEQQHIIKMRSHPSSLCYREIYGKWHESCLYFPQLKGMLNNIT
jgi:hypothetical protein